MDPDDPALDGLEIELCDERVSVADDPLGQRWPSCDCAEQPAVHAALASVGGVLGAWTLPNGRRTPVMFVRRFGPSGPMPPPLIPAFCPFCGERYEDGPGGRPGAGAPSG